VNLEPFSPRQREIITAGEGPLGILAGPGSGKTTTLAGRIGYLVAERGVPPTSILAITFTTAAAGMLRSRLQTVLGSAATHVDIRTFHALGLKLIKAWSVELGYGELPPAVYGREDTRALLRQAAAGLGLALASEHVSGESDPWALSVAMLDRALERFRLRDGRSDTREYERDGLDDALLAQLCGAYEGLLRAHAAVDYASMLLLPLRLFDADPRALHMLQDAYRWVLVDEAQDTCPVQYTLLQRLVERHRNLGIIGDPLQSVYAFRGADPALLQAFTRDYPEARVYVLDENHRSTATIVALANAIAAPLESRPASWTNNPAGPAARLYAASDEVDEARFVGDEIARLLLTGEITHPGQSAVLFRTNAQARALAEALRTRGIPVQLRAESDLFARVEVRDLIAYLRLAHNPTDGPALARVIDTPPRRLRGVERALRKSRVPVADLPAQAQKRGGPPAREAVERLFGLLAELHAAARERRAVQVLETVLDRTGYAVWLASLADGPARMQHVEALHRLLEHSAAPDLATWLADLHLGEAEPGVDDRAVSLLTVHAAKGREWPVVMVTGLEEGLLPHVRSPARGEPEADDAEERRLTYVALSRCQVLLYLTYCRARRPTMGVQVGRPEPRRPSRYLRGLPPPLVHGAA